MSESNKSAPVTAGTTPLAAPVPPSASAPSGPDLAKVPSVLNPVSDAKAKREQHKFWIDTAVKLVQILALVASAGWAVNEYREQHIKDRELRDKELEQAKLKQQEDLDQRERALRMKFYEERRPLYLEACKMAAEIAGSKQFCDVEEAIMRFRVLHYGQMCLVEDQTVLRSMHYFFRGLEEELNSGLKSPTTDMRNRSVILARDCRSSLDLKEVFKIDLPLDTAQLEKKADDPYTF